MLRTMEEIYGDLQSNKCRENKCTVQLNHFVSYCGESMRTRILGNNAPHEPMCDCIVTNNAKTKISLVELKGSTSNTTKISYRLVDEARSQLCGGLTVLHEMLAMMKKNEIDLQLILFTKLSLNRSERVELRKPLPGLAGGITIVDRICGCDLPDAYLRLKRSQLTLVG